MSSGSGCLGLQHVSLAFTISPSEAAFHKTFSLLSLSLLLLLISLLLLLLLIVLLILLLLLLLLLVVVVEVVVHRCGASGSMRACHAAGPGSITVGDKYPG